MGNNCWWESAGSFRQIVRVLKQNFNQDEKDQAFLHFAQRTDKVGKEIFADMLKHEFFSPLSMYRKFYLTGEVSKWENKRSRALVLDYIEPAVSLPKFGTGAVVFDDKFFLKLEYFAAKDKEKFKAMFEKMPALTAFKHYFVDTPNAEIQRKMFAVNKNRILTGAVDYYAWRIDADLEFRRRMRKDKAFGDWVLLDQLVASSNISNLTRFLELDIVPVKEIKERIPAQVMAKKPILSQYVSEDRWKYFDSPVFVYNNIPEGKEWEVFEYVAEHKPEIARYFANNLSEFYAAKIVAHYKGRNLEDLPESAREVLQEQRDKWERNLEHVRRRNYSLQPHKTPEEKIWMDGDNLKKFFTLVDGREIRSKEEYLFIANKFAESGLSVTVFCRKYKVSDVKDFKEFLRHVASVDDELREKLEKRSKGVIEESDDMRQIILGVVMDRRTVADTLTEFDPRTYNFSKIIDFINQNYTNTGIRKKFTAEVIKHYYLRLNGCTDSLEAENLAKRLTNPEVAFILGEAGLAKVVQEREIDMAAEFVKMTADARGGIEKLFSAYAYGNDPKRITMRIKNYDHYFDPNRALGMTMGSIGGSKINVTREVLGQAEAFRERYDLYPSNRTMTSIIRAIAEGKIKETAVQTVTPKEALADARVKAQGAESLEEYFDIFDNV